MKKLFKKKHSKAISVGNNKNSRPKEETLPKEPASNIKGFFKELKRIRWPEGKEAWKVFVISLIFVIISSLILFVITFTFTNIWNSLGVGI